MSGIINPSFNGFNIDLICVDISTFHFPPQKVPQKISSSVPLLNFLISPLCTFWKLKKVELVKNDLHEAQIVAFYCY